MAVRILGLIFFTYLVINQVSCSPLSEDNLRLILKEIEREMNEKLDKVKEKINEELNDFKKEMMDLISGRKICFTNPCKNNGTCRIAPGY